MKYFTVCRVHIGQPVVDEGRLRHADYLTAELTSQLTVHPEVLRNPRNLQSVMKNNVLSMQLTWQFLPNVHKVLGSILSTA